MTEGKRACIVGSICVSVLGIITVSPSLLKSTVYPPVVDKKCTVHICMNRSSVNQIMLKQGENANVA